VGMDLDLDMAGQEATMATMEDTVMDTETTVAEMAMAMAVGTKNFNFNSAGDEQ
jgi:uncharacterized coiled-coil protein SlyX